MAYIRDPKEDEQNGQNLTTSGQSSVVSGGQGGIDPATSAAQGTSWTNLSKYLDANAGLGAGIAAQVTGDSQAKIDSAAGKINEYQAKASTANSGGTAQTAKLEGYKTAIATDPTKVDSKVFRDDTSSGYQGVTDASKIDGYSDAYNAFGTAKSDYSNLKNNDWNARSSVVQNTYGKDNAAYSKGMGLLDTLVLQGDTKGQDGINAFVAKNSGFIGDDSANALSKVKTGVQSGLDTAKGQWDNLLGQGDGSINQVLTQRKGSTVGAIQGRQGQVDSSNAALNEKQTVLGDLATELRNRKQGDAVYMAAATNRTLGDFSTDAERAELDALVNLGAGDYDRSLVAKSAPGSANASSLVFDKASGTGQDEYDFDPQTNTLKTRQKYVDGSYSNWSDLKGGGSGALGTWLDKYLTTKGF